MFCLAHRRRALGHFLVAATFTLPNRKRAARISRTLINRAIGRYYFAAATRTDATARGPLFNVDAFQTFFSHKDPLCQTHDDGFVSGGGCTGSGTGGGAGLTSNDSRNRTTREFFSSAPITSNT